jgi:hypothetical protein
MDVCDFGYKFGGVSVGGAGEKRNSDGDDSDEKRRKKYSQDLLKSFIRNSQDMKIITPIGRLELRKYAKVGSPVRASRHLQKRRLGACCQRYTNPFRQKRRFAAAGISSQHHCRDGEAAK